MNTDSPAQLLLSLRDQVEAAIARCEEKNWLGAKFRFQVVLDVCKDFETSHAGTAHLAEFAAKSDETAVQMLRSAAGDGLTADDAAAVSAACDLITASALADREIGRCLRPPDPLAQLLQ